MLSIYEIKDYVDEYLKSININIVTVIDYETPHIMAYNKNSNTIKINCDTKYLYNNAKSLNTKLKDFLIISIVHEVGHSLDSEGKGRFQRETNAYKLGLKYIPKRLLEKYNYMNELNIKKYDIQQNVKA
jgi:hypothetical protein